MLSELSEPQAIRAPFWLVVVKLLITTIKQVGVIIVQVQTSQNLGGLEEETHRSVSTDLPVQANLHSTLWHTKFIHTHTSRVAYRIFFLYRGGKLSKTVFHVHAQYTAQEGVGTRLLISYVTVCLTIDPKDFRGPLLYAT